MARRLYPFSNYAEFKVWLDSVEPTDQYGFEKATNNEPDPEQIKRLKYNLAVYRAYMQNQSRFPQELHAQRKWEFGRLRELNGGNNNQ